VDTDVLKREQQALAEQENKVFVITDHMEHKEGAYREKGLFSSSQKYHLITNNHMQCLRCWKRRSVSFPYATRSAISTISKTLPLGYPPYLFCDRRTTLQIDISAVDSTIPPKHKHLYIYPSWIYNSNAPLPLNSRPPGSAIEYIYVCVCNDNTIPTLSFPIDIYPYDCRVSSLLFLYVHTCCTPPRDSTMRCMLTTLVCHLSI
jgi:hypothetical protein